MAEQLRCARGHQWRLQPGAPTVCPVCGGSSLTIAPTGTVDFEVPAPASPRPAASDGTIDSESDAPSPPVTQHPAHLDRTIDSESDAPVRHASPDPTYILADKPPDTYRLDPKSVAHSDRTGEWTVGDTGTPKKGHTPDRTGEWSSQDDLTSHSVSPDDPKKVGEEGQPTVPGYEILSELGRGAMGVVYKARQAKLKRLVALKMILAGAHASDREMMRFQIEAEAVARVKHPNIVQVFEVGEANGCPYFSLEFVDGGDLASLILDNPMPPMEAAGIVEQLARAMDCAHRSGVVHRDLKPANILIAARGSAANEAKPQAAIPKITDFGLAKRLGDDSSKTRAGAIMGTPSYMAPEQAEGRNDDIGPAADIYALGAIFYDCLTGRPPFQGTTVLETLQLVKAMEPMPVRRLQPGVPRDLETICLKCLAKEPGKRYASALDLAEDLRRYQNGEPILARRSSPWERTVKWCKRRPAAAGLVGLSALTVLGLIGGGFLYANHERQRAETEQGLRQTAEEQRGLAQQNFREAQAAVDLMLTRVAEERLEYEPRMEQVRRDLLEEALRFYGRFLEQKSDDPQIRWETGRAFKKVGEIRFQLGDQKAAAEAYRSAREVFDALVKEHPRDASYQQDLAATLNNLGGLLLTTGNKDEAAKWQRQAMKLQKQLTETNPDRLAYRQELATSCYNLALIDQSLGRHDDAIPLLKESLSLQEQLIREDGANPAYRRELARTHRNYAELHKTKGNASEAAKHTRAALQLLDVLVNRNPAAPGDRQELAQAHRQLGSLLQLSSEKDADKEYRKAVELGESLVSDFPTVPDYKQDLAASCNARGVVLAALGDAAGADRNFQRGLSLKEELVANFPRKPAYRRDLAAGYGNHASQMLTQKRHRDGEAAYRKASALLTALADEFPKEPEYQQEASRTLVNLATLLMTTNQGKEAEKTFRFALERCETLVKAYPSVPAYELEQARTLFLLATQLQRSGQVAESEKRHRRSEELFRDLIKRQPNEVDHRVGLASCLNNLADLLRATNRADAALKMWTEAGELHAALAITNPGVTTYPQERAKMLHNIGVTLAALAKYEDAEKAHREALKLRETFAKTPHADPVYLLELASSHGELAIVQAQLNRLNRSVESFREAIGLLKAHPTRSDYIEEEIVQQSNLGGLLKAMGNDKEAEDCQKRVKELKQLLARRTM